MDVILIYLSCANDAEALKIANHLLDKKLIACSKRAPISSVYWWKGEKDSADESLLIMETFADKFEAIEEEVKKVHSYSQIVMLAIPVIKSAKGVSEWIDEALN